MYYLYILVTILFSNLQTVATYIYVYSADDKHVFSSVHEYLKGTVTGFFWINSKWSPDFQAEKS